MSARPSNYDNLGNIARHAGLDINQLDDYTKGCLITLAVITDSALGILQNPDQSRKIDSPTCTLTDEQKTVFWKEMFFDQLGENISRYFPHPPPHNPSQPSKIFWAAMGFLTACLCFAVYHWKTCHRLRI